MTLGVCEIQVMWMFFVSVLSGYVISGLGLSE